MVGKIPRNSSRHLAAASEGRWASSSCAKTASSISSATCTRTHQTFSRFSHWHVFGAWPIKVFLVVHHPFKINQASHRKTGLLLFEDNLQSWMRGVLLAHMCDVGAHMPWKSTTPVLKPKLQKKFVAQGAWHNTKPLVASWKRSRNKAKMASSAGSLLMYL